MKPLKTPIRHFLLVIPVVVCAIVSAGGAFGAEPDGDAAQALAKKSNCLKCHSIDKKKDGPAFKVTAEKYKGKAELFARYEVDKNAALRLSLSRQSLTLDEWSWGYDGKPFVYSDNTTVNMNQRQSVNLLGVSYIYRF